MWHWLALLTAPALAHELEVERNLRRDAENRLLACERQCIDAQHTISRLNAENNDLLRQLREMETSEWITSSSQHRRSSGH